MYQGIGEERGCLRLRGAVDVAVPLGVVWGRRGGEQLQRNFVRLDRR